MWVLVRNVSIADTRSVCPPHPPGNLLILPTTIAWSAVMDNVGLWVVPTVSSTPPAACVTPPPAKAG